MAIRFFKKLTPETRVVLVNNQGIQFTTLDHLTGYFATDNDYVAGEFIRLMGENRYGITEIEAEEFQRDYVQKKTNTTPLRNVSREEMVGGRLRGQSVVETLGSQAVQAAVGVKTVDESALKIEDAQNAPVNQTPLSTPTAPEAFRPPVGQRKRRNRA